MTEPRLPLRIFYLEDNPLIAFHVQALIEDLGHILVGTLSSFSDLKASIAQFEMDGALVDVDLADGRTGPAAAEWLLELGIPSVFVTGQEQLAARYPAISRGILSKPIMIDELAAKLELFTQR
jgi:DNA-binding response OmpR family regulator